MILAATALEFGERLFSVCGMLTMGRRNTIETVLKVNCDELKMI